MHAASPQPPSGPATRIPCRTKNGVLGGALGRAVGGSGADRLRAAGRAGLGACRVDAGDGRSRAAPCARRRRRRSVGARCRLCLAPLDRSAIQRRLVPRRRSSWPAAHPRHGPRRQLGARPRLCLARPQRPGLQGILEALHGPSGFCACAVHGPGGRLDGGAGLSVPGYPGGGGVSR